MISVVMGSDDDKMKNFIGENWSGKETALERDSRTEIT